MNRTLEFISNKKADPSELSRFSNALGQLLKREDLGFFKWPQYGEEYARIIEVAKNLRRETTRLVVIGLGGSQTGGQCLIHSVSGPNHNVEFWGEIDPLFIEPKLESPLLEDTTFLIISKSGNTLEVATLMNILNEKLVARGLDLASRSFVITENRENNPLRQWALAADVPVIDHPLDVGGRFSVFTPVGIFPAVFAGVDAEQVRQGALWMLTQENLVAEVAHYFSSLFVAKKSITVFWSYVAPLAAFQKWLEQIWAESLGQSKDKSGNKVISASTPLMVEGVSSQHSVLQQFMEGEDDKGFLFLRLQKAAEMGPKMRDSLLPGFEFLSGKTTGEVFAVESQSVQAALTRNQRPCASLELNRVDAYTIGALLMLFELVVGTLGEAYNVNVYVQPGVELGKTLALQKLRA